MNSMFRFCLDYDQDISDWRVPLILIKPPLFDFNTPLSWSEGEKPDWGEPC